MKRKMIIALVLLAGAFWLFNRESKEPDLTGSNLLPKLNMSSFVVKKDGKYAAFCPKKNGRYEYRKVGTYLIR